MLLHAPLVPKIFLEKAEITLLTQFSLLRHNVSLVIALNTGIMLLTVTVTCGEAFGWRDTIFFHTRWQINYVRQ